MTEHWDVVVWQSASYLGGSRYESGRGDWISWHVFMVMLTNSTAVHCFLGFRGKASKGVCACVVIKMKQLHRKIGNNLPACRSTYSVIV
jgi:hypothetical protein